MFVGDERGEMADRKENTDASGEDSFMLRRDQNHPLDVRASPEFRLLFCCLELRNDLGEGMSATVWPSSRDWHLVSDCGRLKKERTV